MVKGKTSIDYIEVFNDWLKGIDAKTFKIKYSLDMPGVNDIVDSILVTYKDIYSIHFRNMILDYNKGNTYKQISIKYGMNIEVCKKIINSLDEYKKNKRMPNNLKEFRRNQRKVNTIIKNSVQIRKNNVENYSKQIKDGKAILVTEAYKSGFYENYIKEKFKVSSETSYLCSIEGPISQDKLTDLKDIYVYKNLLSKAYDENIITDDMLNILFKLNEKEVDKLKVTYDNSVRSYVSNKLYQIYHTPSLLYNFTFTSDEMEYNALSFINRRYAEELMKIYNSDKDMSKIEQLREIYYGSKSNKYIEKVKRI